MSDIEQAIVAVLAGQPHDSFEEERLRSIVDDLARAGCRGIVDKLLEARTASPSRFEDLIGELRLARSVSRQLTTAIRFDVGDAADIQFTVDDCHCLLEVVHKSAPSLRRGGARCGAKEPPEHFCSSCDTQLEDLDIEFCERGTSGAELTQELCAERCATCERVYVSECALDSLAEFVAAMPPDLRILPELGIVTSAYMEIFVAAYEHPIVALSSRTLPLRIAVQHQSELFAECLDRITRWDVADFGHEMGSTLRIEPPPPYSDDQRREIQLLLSQLARQGQTSLHFWTARFVPSYSNYPEGPLARLATVMETWRLGIDRTALSLVSKAIGGSAQGPFINIFRLLELVLKRQAEDELVRVRFDSAVTREQFLAKIRSLEHDLASRLRQRVQGLSKCPEETLESIWKLAVPGRGYNAGEVFNHIAKLRNQNVHEPSSDEALRLPWEELAFDELTELVAELIAEIVEVYEQDVRARS